MRKARHGIGRGVWVAPWMGPNGETVLVAINHQRRLVAERLLSPGDNHVAAGDELWRLLDDSEAIHLVEVI